ncbi:MAG TPA: hypothetical protein VGM92_14945 [Candidatus Kapabacteria bacterium]
MSNQVIVGNASHLPWSISTSAQESDLPGINHPFGTFHIFDIGSAVFESIIIDGGAPLTYGHEKAHVPPYILWSQNANTTVIILMDADPGIGKHTLVIKTKKQ